MTRLSLVPSIGPVTGLPERVLAPSTTMARRAGLTPIVVPADLWIAPELLAMLAPGPPHLRIVA